MKLSDLLNGIEITDRNVDLDTEITGISYDSRKTKPGELFVAVRGFESDGHKFISSALEKGAVCVLAEEAPDLPAPYLITPNTRRALAAAASNWFGKPADKMKIIGITGTNGKTTVTSLIKELIESVFGAKVGLIGTNHNMIGSEILETERTTPESFELQALFAEMAQAGCEYVVMEVSSHALYLDRVWGIEFEVGLFTNLTRDHLDFHKTMEEYGKAKALLFRQSKKGIVNMDDEFAPTMLENAACPVYTFSAEKNEADLTAKGIELKPDGVRFSALIMGSLERVSLAIPGMFSVYNALAALAVMLNLGAELPQAAAAIKDCCGVKGRAEVVPTGRDFTVIIDYAHTPDALENIITTVRGFATGRVVTLLGCGGDRDKTKRPIMGEIAARLSDLAIVTSDNPRTEEPSAIIEDILAGIKDGKKAVKVIENRRDAIAWSVQNAQPGDIIILAGKGHETYQIIGKEKHHFDEREVIREALN